MNVKYFFYLQAVNKNGVPLEAERSIEDAFDGLRYLRADGIDIIGKPKNIYTEVYADSDTLRTHVPETILNEATTITLTLAFIGPNRHQTRDAFNEYIRNGYHRYRDTFRNRAFIFFVQDIIEPKEEQFIGSEPYIQVEYKLSNIKGNTEKVK
jgi:hypothetical protein